MAGFCCRAQGRKVLHKKKSRHRRRSGKAGAFFAPNSLFFCANPKGLTLRNEHGNVFFGHMRRCGIKGDFPYRVFEIRDGDRARARCVFCTLPAQYRVDAAVRVLCALRHTARGLQRHWRFARHFLGDCLRGTDAAWPDGLRASVQVKRRLWQAAGALFALAARQYRVDAAVRVVCALRHAACGGFRREGVLLPGCCGGFLVFFRGLQFLEVRIAERWPGRAAQGGAKVGIRGRDGALTREGEATACFSTRLLRGWFLRR